jgi:hypothetical protein
VPTNFEWGFGRVESGSRVPGNPTNQELISSPLGPIDMEELRERF